MVRSAVVSRCHSTADGAGFPITGTGVLSSQCVHLDTGDSPSGRGRARLPYRRVRDTEKLLLSS